MTHLGSLVSYLASHSIDAERRSLFFSHDAEPNSKSHFAFTVIAWYVVRLEPDRR